MSLTQHSNPDSIPFAGRHTADEDLAAKIRRLQAERHRHIQAIDEIDKVLGQVQHVLTDLDASSPQAGQAHRRYQKFELTGEESVLAFVRSHGNPTTSEVNAHWHEQGRTGVANPILARLLKRSLLRRENDAGVRGSRYRANPQVK